MDVSFLQFLILQSLSNFIVFLRKLAANDPELTLELLAYLGYITPPEENQLSSLQVTRDKRVDLQKRQTSRNVFTCHLIGPQGAGKTSFMQGYLGKNLDEISENLPQQNQNSNFVVDTIPIYGQEKYLIVQRVCSTFE